MSSVLLCLSAQKITDKNIDFQNGTVKITAKKYNTLYFCNAWKKKKKKKVEFVFDQYKAALKIFLKSDEKNGVCH